MATHDYKQLDVWKRSMDLVVRVYDIAKLLPVEEKYALADQLVRAVVSVPSNIAEGQKRASRKETMQFSYIALGSVAEVETQLMIAERLYDLEVKSALEDCEAVGRMLTALTRSLKKML